jgi:type VI protein secretion system component VasF
MTTSYERLKCIIDSFHKSSFDLFPGLRPLEYRQGTSDEIQLIRIYEMISSFLSDMSLSDYQKIPLTPQRRSLLQSRTPKRLEIYMKMVFNCSCCAWLVFLFLQS